MTVKQSPFINPPSNSVLRSIGTPPASNMSLATYFPPGFKSARYGVFLNISATSIISNLIPHSFAIAGKCKAALVDPPVAATITAAFFKDSIVTMSLGLILFFNNAITAFPLS